MQERFTIRDKYGQCGCLSENHSKAMNKLGDFEDAEEKGLLLRLPCKVGDVIYSICNNAIYPVKATKELHLVNGKLHILCESCRFSDLVSYDDLGKTAFLVKEDAEKALIEAKRSE